MFTYTVDKYYLTVGKEYFQTMVFIREHLVVTHKYDTTNIILNRLFINAFNQK